MTDNEIRPYDGMTALEQLNLYRNLHYCEGLANERGVIANAINDLLSQFNRQKAEIERLKGRKKVELSDGCKSCQHSSVCYEIENLKCRNEFIWYQAESGCPYFQSDVKADATKEFTERFKSIAGIYQKDTYVIGVDEFDNLVKEMVGDDG